MQDLSDTAADRRTPDILLTELAAGGGSFTLSFGCDAGSILGEFTDLDASVFLLGPEGLVLDNNGLIFYRRHISACGGVRHAGDNRAAREGGDLEQIDLQLDYIPGNIDSLAITLSLHDHDDPDLEQPGLKGCWMRVTKGDGGELLRLDYADRRPAGAGFVLALLVRKGSGWLLRPGGFDVAGGLSGLCARFGVEVG